jgi:tetratricopeptide (TPR) repeat protein
VKPSNIIFVNGRPKLADIGLVAGVDEARSFVGTEGFIPPEGPGKPQADLYSLGKVLYEAGMGRSRLDFPSLPADWDSLPADEQSRLAEFNEVLVKACEGDPRRRYRTAEEMRRDLERLQRGRSIRRQRTLEEASRWAKRLVPAALVLVLIGVAALTLTRQLRQTALPPEKASVFVLPLRSEGTNEVDVDVCSRITDAFIDSLASIEGVRRSPRKSGWRWLDEDEIRHALAQTNDMRHILTGWTASAGDTLTFTLRLYPRGGDRPDWSGTFIGETNEVVELERRGLAQLASQLGLKVIESEQRNIDQLLTNNLEALRWYQQARAAYTRKGGTQSGFAEVRKPAQQAMDLDPLYLDADLWDAYMIRNLAQDRAPSDVWRDVQRRMASILDQDDTVPDALDHMTGYTLFYQRDWETTYVLWNRRVLYDAPQRSRWVRAFFCRMYGWFDEARVDQELSERPEPIDPDQRYFMASSRWLERRYADGVQVARRTLELLPGHAEGYFWLAHCLVANGNYEEGIEATHKAQEVWKKQEMTALRGYAYAKMGQPEKAREILRELLDVHQAVAYVQPYFVARVCAALGENDQALDWLEKAEKDRSEYLFMVDLGGLRTDLAWDCLQDEPRYWALCDKLGLGKDQWPRKISAPK